MQSSPDYFYERVDSGERHRSRTLVKLSKEGAAVMIQKFIKQHLKQKGFYQQESVHSPERDPCINLYVANFILPNGWKRKKWSEHKLLHCLFGGLFLDRAVPVFQSVPLTRVRAKRRR